jgi:hypothetical protein
MRYLAFSMLLLAPLATAQEPVAPTAGETVGPPQGENTGNYNIVQSWELGYRYSLVGGDDEKYRADVNYTDGIRLLASFLTINSKNGHGRWFDDLLLTTQGLGGDPYESVTLRIRKNRLYQYDLHWRENSYFDPGLTTSEGLHLQNLTQRWQDHDLLLFPTDQIQIKAGFSTNSETGPALSTINLFDNEQGNVFPLFSNEKLDYKSFRLGADFNFLGFKLSLLHRWEYFEDDTPYTAGPEVGLPPLNTTMNLTTLTSFNRTEPIKGRTPGWLGNLVTERNKYAVHGRFAYSDGTGTFVLDEGAIGTGLTGTENRMINAFGTGHRPVLDGDLTVSYFPTDRITVTNSTSVNDQRTDGNNFYQELDLATLTLSEVNFQYLAIRFITNSTTLHFRVNKKLDFFTGYRYADREISSIQSETNPGTPFVNTLYTQYDHVNAGVAGFNWKILAPLTLHVSTEIGRNDNPFFPISEKNYLSLDGRLQYRHKSITASTGYKQYYNNNSITLTAYDVHSRNYFANFSWAAKSWFALDTTFNRMHLDTAGGIAFFASVPSPTLETGESIYISNIYAGNLGAHIALTKRADLYLGYSITKDVGDGRSNELPVGTLAALLYNVQTYPLTYESPVARLTIPITKKLKWNAGYQYYGYHEEFGLFSLLQNYHAHTGYTSLLFSF